MYRDIHAHKMNIYDRIMGDFYILCTLLYFSKKKNTLNLQTRTETSTSFYISPKRKIIHYTYKQEQRLLFLTK